MTIPLRGSVNQVKRPRVQALIRWHSLRISQLSLKYREHTRVLLGDSRGLVLSVGRLGVD